MDEGRNVAAQVEQRMQLDRSLGGTERRPWKQRQTQVDGGGIQSVYGVVQIDAEAVVAVQLARTPNEQCGQVLPDAPVASFVGIGQRRALYRRAEGHAVKLCLVRPQAGLDVAQTRA